MKLVFRMPVLLFLLFAVACGAKNAGRNTSGLVIDPAIAAKLDTAYFASGCFWCTEAVFERVKGVEDVVSGYSGGTSPNPTYHRVGSGSTNYAESVRILYNPEVISYRSLLEIFFGSHDPTQLNRQGPDVGKQYRSEIFYQTGKEKNTAEEVKRELNKSEYNNKIATKISKFISFYEAENYHQGYYDLHPNDPYVRSVSKPKVEKFIKHFNDKLKDEYRH